MINNREIWLSSLSLSNDTMEGKWLRKVFREICADEKLGESATNKTIESIENMDKIVDGLGFCLSEHEDMLSQWRGYASDASGMCIGFSKDYLEELAKATQSEEKPGFVLMQVEYDNEKQKSLIKPTYQKMKQFIDKGAFNFHVGGTILTPKTEEEIVAEIAKQKHALAELFFTMFDFIPHLFRLKNPAFEEEREWRLISNHIRVGNDECEFRASSTGIIPYRKFEIPEEENGPIVEVILGPKNITTIEVVESFLNHCGFFDVKVTSSEATYR